MLCEKCRPQPARQSSSRTPRRSSPSRSLRSEAVGETAPSNSDGESMAIFFEEIAEDWGSTWVNQTENPIMVFRFKSIPAFGRATHDTGKCPWLVVWVDKLGHISGVCLEARYLKIPRAILSFPPKNSDNHGEQIRTTSQHTTISPLETNISCFVPSGKLT